MIQIKMLLSFHALLQNAIKMHYTNWFNKWHLKLSSIREKNTLQALTHLALLTASWDRSYDYILILYETPW